MTGRRDHSKRWTDGPNTDPDPRRAEPQGTLFTKACPDEARPSGYEEIETVKRLIFITA